MRGKRTIALVDQQGFDNSGGKLKPTHCWENMIPKQILSRASHPFTEGIDTSLCFIIPSLAQLKGLFEHVKATHFFEQDSILENGIKEKLQQGNSLPLFEAMLVPPCLSNKTFYFRHLTCLALLSWRQSLPKPGSCIEPLQICEQSVNNVKDGHASTNMGLEYSEQAGILLLRFCQGCFLIHSNGKQINSI